MTIFNDDTTLAGVGTLVLDYIKAHNIKNQTDVLSEVAVKNLLPLIHSILCVATDQDHVKPDRFMGFLKVSLVQDESSHWYCIPSQLSEDFSKWTQMDYDNLSDEDLEKWNKYDNTFDPYMIGGDLSLVDIYSYVQLPKKVAEVPS